MAEMTFQGQSIQLMEGHGEPTVRDVDLGVRLGMKRPDKIRQIIRRNLPEIEGYGPLSSAGTMVDIGSGARREITEYHLTEEQALCVCQLSRAPKSKEVRRMLIEVFTAYRRGQLVPDVMSSATGGMFDARVNRALAEVVQSLLPSMVDAALQRDPRIAAVDAIPALAVVEQKKVDKHGRRRVVQMASNRLVRFCETHGYSVTRDLTGRRLFPRSAVRHWLSEGGWSAVQDLADKIKGQSRLRLV